MKRIAIFCIGVLGLAAIVHVATVRAIPRVIMSKALASGPQNVFHSPPLATAQWHGIVRPSPDLAYSACRLDLAKGPARIIVPLTAPYTSVSFFSATSDNYFVVNDRDAGGKSVDMIVAAPGAAGSVKAPEGVTVIESPTERTMVVVRRVVDSAEAFPSIDAIRRQATCDRFGG